MRVVWRRIARALSNELAKEGELRVVVLCIGNEMMGDDGFGPYVAKKIKGLERVGFVKIVDCGMVPENYTNIIRDVKPTHVIIIDAVDFGGAPGDVILSFEPKFDGISVSTHKPSLSMLSKYIKLTVGSKIILMGVQPKNVDFGLNMSDEVLAAGDVVIRALKSTFKRLRAKLSKHS